ncbi:hypothetical protein EV424DRAFT_1352616 [Suillus variegatus]|nr:hypothetical protein EV424DRAFT_1352616 [Suillus variegatus]
MFMRLAQLSDTIKMEKTLTSLKIKAFVQSIILSGCISHTPIFFHASLPISSTSYTRECSKITLLAAMSEFHGLRHFKQGISTVSQWTCTQHKEMQRVILDNFHTNKEVFVELGLREHFNIPKDAYQASNKVDYIAQMTHWLELQEAVFRQGVYLDLVASQSRDPLADSDLDALEEEDEEEELADSDTMTHTPDVLLSQFTPSGLLKSHGYHVAKTCPFLNISTSRLQTDFGAIDFIPALQTFLTRHFPHSSISASEYDRFDVFKLVLLLLPQRNHISDVKRLNRIQAHPAIPNCNHRKPPSPAHFDVAFIVEDCQLWESGTGFDGLWLAQICAIFKLSSQYGEFPHPLAYIEWFRPLREPEAATRLYRVAWSTRNQQRFAAVISVQDLLQGGHLFPRFGSGKVDVSWINSDVLELANEFYVNPYINFYLFDTMERL